MENEVGLWDGRKSTFEDGFRVFGGLQVVLGRVGRVGHLLHVLNDGGRQAVGFVEQLYAFYEGEAVRSLDEVDDDWGAFVSHAFLGAKAALIDIL